MNSDRAINGGPRMALAAREGRVHTRAMPARRKGENHALCT